jgi:hypothetical protein
MSNFEKKLEDATEEDLKRWINEYDFRVVPLASDELTRRYLKSLQSEIKNFNNTSTKYSEKLIDLTLILFVVAFLQLFISVRTISSSWGEWLFLVAIILYAFYLIVRPIIRAREKKGKDEKSKN